jgi:hypothetical protein
MRFPDKATVEWIRKQYPKGMRVELVSMSDPYAKLKAGDKGTVDFVDDTGTVFVKWDSGSGLGVVYGEDSIKRVPVITAVIKEQILAIRDGAETNMFDAIAVQRLAFDKGFHELVDFIETDRKAYATYILTGEG